MMTEQELNKRIKRFNDAVLNENAPTSPQEAQNGASGQDMVNYTDLWEEGRRERLDASQKQYPRGASPKVAIATMTIIQNLAPRYRKVKNENEYLIKIGDKARAKLLRDGYMNDTFLPALESLVNIYGVDEIINSKRTLEKLDDMVLIDGGSGRGYSEAFIRALHDSERGIAPAISDGVVENSVRTIRVLVGRDEIRNAVGVAKRIMGQIEKGQHSASEEDWELISTVAMRG